jgi:hypothetical protein
MRLFILLMKRWGKVIFAKAIAIAKGRSVSTCISTYNKFQIVSICLFLLSYIKSSLIDISSLVVWLSMGMFLSFERSANIFYHNRIAIVEDLRMVEE